jgi:hypothetical protein
MIPLGKYAIAYKIVCASKETGKKYSATITDPEWIVEYKPFKKVMPKQPITPLFVHGRLRDALSTILDWMAFGNDEGKEMQWELWISLVEKPKKVYVVADMIDNETLSEFWYANSDNPEIRWEVDHLHFYGAESVRLLLKVCSENSLWIKPFVPLKKLINKIYFRRRG